MDSTAICGFITTWLASVQNGGTVVADFKVSAFPTAWLAAVVAPAAG